MFHKAVRVQFNETNFFNESALKVPAVIWLCMGTNQMKVIAHVPSTNKKIVQDAMPEFWNSSLREKINCPNINGNTT